MKQVLAIVFCFLCMLSTAHAYHFELSDPALVVAGNRAFLTSNLTPQVQESQDSASMGGYEYTRTWQKTTVDYTCTFSLVSDYGNTGTATVRWDLTMFLEDYAVGVSPYADVEYELWLRGPGVDMWKEKSELRSSEVVGYDDHGTEIRRSYPILRDDDWGAMDLQLGQEYVFSLKIEFDLWASNSWWESPQDGWVSEDPTLWTEIYDSRFIIDHGDETGPPAVPEPSTFLLAGLGLAGLALLRKRLS